MAERVSVKIENRQLSLSNLDKVLYPHDGLHQGRGDRLLHPNRAGAPAPSRRSTADDQALPERRRQALLLREERRPRHAVLGADGRLPVPGSTMNRDTHRLRRRRRTGRAGVAGQPGRARTARAAVAIAASGRKPRTDLIVFDLDPGPPATIVECCEVALAPARPARGRRTRPGREDVGKQGHAGERRGVRPTIRNARPLRARGRPRARSEPTPSSSSPGWRSRCAPGKVFVDWSQNNPAKTTVAPYSLAGPRAADGVDAADAGTRSRPARRCRFTRRRGARSESRTTAICSPARWTTRRGAGCPSATLPVSRLQASGFGPTSRAEDRSGMPTTVDAGRGGRLPRVARRKQLLAAAQEVFVANGYHARRDGRHRRARRRLQAGALPALSRQARAVPRAARHAGRRAGRHDRERSRRDRRQPRARPRRALGLLRLRRRIDRQRSGRVPAHLRDRSRQRAGGARASRAADREDMHAVADTVAADTGLSRAAGRTARDRADRGGPGGRALVARQRPPGASRHRRAV